ncbi:carbamate kinase [Marinomonas sp.]|uniref:carbamate kinase n=1 Tax=Marinomonas sp. TaxID=1904862 RepID=UPI003A947ADF
MRIVVALGGNALLKRGEPLTAQAQRENIKIAAQALAKIAINNELIITHGNGPQVGLLALQGNAYKPDELYPLDVLGAETEGMIGYMIEQEMGNLVPAERPLATLLTMIEVDPKDPAFNNPTKFIGPVYEEAEANKLAQDNNWTIKPDGKKWRRVVASPLPKRIFEIRPIRWLLEKNTIVIASGGGGIPTMYDADHHLKGVEAVIDKDLSSELLARELGADLYIMATDVQAVYLDWATPQQRGIKSISPADLANYDFATGSMGPKVNAARQFAEKTGKVAAIGSLEELESIVKGTAGTRVSKQVGPMESY